jgi:hypothetical protein
MNLKKHVQGLLSDVRFAARSLRRSPGFSIATGLFVIAAHDRRHLWQAEQVRQAPGFRGPPSTVRG